MEPLDTEKLKPFNGKDELKLESKVLIDYNPTNPDIVTFIFTKVEPNEMVELDVAAPCAQSVDLPADIDFEELAALGIDISIVNELIYIPQCTISYNANKDETRVMVSQFPNADFKALIEQIGFVLPADMLIPKDGFRPSEKSEELAEKHMQEYEEELEELTTHHEDGSYTIDNEDGTSTTFNTDGTFVENKADGTKTKHHRNGATTDIDTDGTETTHNYDGSTTKQKPTGDVEHTNEDGS